MASYKGNLGIMELIKFNQVATPAQKAKLDSLLNKGDAKGIWKLVYEVTGVKLHGKDYS